MMAAAASLPVISTLEPEHRMYWMPISSLMVMQAMVEDLKGDRIDGADLGGRSARSKTFQWLEAIRVLPNSSIRALCPVCSTIVVPGMLDDRRACDRWHPRCKAAPS